MCVCARAHVLSHVCLCNSMNCSPSSFFVHNFPGKNTGAGCHFLLQGIFLTQGSNSHLLCLLHWQADFLPLHHLGSISMIDYLFLLCSIHCTSLVAQMVKCLPAMQETWVRSLGQEDPLEKEMATHSSTLAGKSHGQRRLAGYSPWGHKESDMIEWLHFNACITLFVFFFFF